MLMRPFVGAWLAIFTLMVFPLQAEELNVWIMATTVSQQKDTKDLLKPYLDKHPDLRVNITVLTWEFAWPRIKAAAESGQGPDVLEIGSTWAGALSAMGALAPLTPAQIAEVGGQKAFFPALWSTTHAADDPQTYSIPWYGDARVLFYRTDVFRKAGLNPVEAFAGWESFKRALQKINGMEIEGKKIHAFGYPGKTFDLVHNLAPWIWNAGGDFLTPDLKSSALTSPEALRAVDFYVGLVAEGLTPRFALEKSPRQIEMDFFDGDYAVISSGSWLFASIKTPKARGGEMESTAAQNFGVAAYPPGEKGANTFFGGSNLAIMKSSNNKEEAWRLLAYMVGKEPQIRYAQLTSNLPALIEATLDERVSGDRNYKALLAVIKNGRAYPTIPAWAPLETLLRKDLTNLFQFGPGTKGQYSLQGIKDSLEATSRDMNNVLGQKY
ncbi:MAG: extracellular solute-binding protein [Rhodocyclales bacterium]|nr:extracellular solute-binding protein [Rhodocyclales bacterium]